MGRAGKWLATLVAGAVAFLAVFWLGWRFGAPLLPRDLPLGDRRAVIAGLAAAVTGVVVAAGAWWAGRRPDPTGDRHVRQVMTTSQVTGGGPHSITVGQVGRDVRAGRGRD